MKQRWQCHGHLFCVALAAVAVLLLPGSTASAKKPPKASFRGLGFLPNGANPTSVARAVSADGRAVAGMNSSDAGFEAFRWTPQTGMVGLGFLPGLTDSEAFGISGDGAVVVGASSSLAGRAAFRWTAQGGMQFLGQEPDNIVAAFARAVSADGSVVVGSGDSDRGQIAFRWSTSGGMVGLGALGTGRASIGEGVSGDGGVVVGSSTTGPSGAFPLLPFRWTPATGMLSLPLLPGATGGNAAAVSADGRVTVGNCNFQTPQGLRPEATRWAPGRGPLGLGFLKGYESGSLAFAASADGSVVVGTSESADGALAFVWDAKHGMRSLDHLLRAYGLRRTLRGWTLWSANGVSADGRVIVGVGTNPRGQNEAFLAALAEHPR